MSVNLLFILILFILHTVCLSLLCPVRFGIKKTVMIWGGIIVSSAAVTFWLVHALPLVNGAHFAMAITIIPSVAAVFYLSRYSAAKTLFLFLTYAQAFWVILFFSGLLSNLFFEGKFLLAAIIRTALHIGVALLCMVLRRPFLSVSQKIPKGWWPLNLVALLFVAYLGYLAPLSYAQEISPFALVSFTLLLSVIITVYVVFFYTIRYMNEAARTKQAELQSEYLLGKIEAMQEMAEATGRARHDMRHHNLLIAQYAKKGQSEELLHYLGEYEKAFDNQEEPNYCENLAANNILSTYVQKARKLGIEVRLGIILEQNIAITDIDLVAMLANLMENAINGCIHSGEPQPLIELQIRRKASKLVIYERNTAGEDTQFEDGIPVSVAGNGIGVSSILSSAKRYGGEYDFKLEQGVFSCQLLLKATLAV